MKRLDISNKNVLLYVMATSQANPLAKQYLTNKELLKEIHLSKNNYSSYTQPEYGNYDLILADTTKINIRTIAEAKRNQALRLSQLALAEAQKINPKTKLAEVEIDYKKVAKTDVVFRIMTHDHVPLEPGRKKTPKNRGDHHSKCNFPPFQHFKFSTEDGAEKDDLICVGKSHWRGDMDTGAFNLEGQITKKLAKSYMLLCERYSMRFNWRGYTYVDEMRSQALLQLSQIGLQFDESKSQNPFAYYTAAIDNSFTRILNIEKKNQTIRDDLLIEYGSSPSFSRQFEHEATMRDERDRLAGLKD
jgi:hypothetical protein